ncbi:hypothetical protein ABT354_35700 [Streptomyces sp. NPDC000594]|uniref:DUF7848 domain-containing protein n=1 Tax=Streptomyces sp. NPDC000594 TaxID=3154261 RepID=UPI00331A9DC5
MSAHLVLSPVPGAPTTRVLQCTRCEASSPLMPPVADFEGWALGHVLLTGHQVYQQVTTELLGVVPGGGVPS